MPDDGAREHEDYMRRCLALAVAARERGDVPVGALVVRGGDVVAEAGERVPTGLDITGHAEILAIRQACQVLGSTDLSDCTLYTSAEPCWMCSYAIREARVGRVVMGARTPDVGGLSSRYPLLADPTVPGWSPPPRLVRDVLRNECEAVRGG